MLASGTYYSTGGGAVSVASSVVVGWQTGSSGTYTLTKLADIERILWIWRDCLGRWGGPWLLGAERSVADAMYAPVVTRFVTYSVPVPRFAAAYMETILDHAWMKEWIEAAQEEPWVIEQYEVDKAA